MTQATSLGQRDVVTGLVPNSQMIHVEVALKLRNRSELDSLINASQQRRPMSHSDFAARYSPTLEQANQVVDFLNQAGFRNVSIAPNRLLVSADGTAAVVQAAFSTSLSAVRTADGRSAFANTTAAQVPDSLKGIVLSVVGLQNVHVPHIVAHAVGTDGYQTDAVTGHYPTEFSSIYGGSGVATAASVPVGIITQGRLNQTITDLNTFTSANGLPTVTTQTVNTNGTSSDTSGVVEWNLDSQDIVGMAGGQVQKLYFYNIPTLSNTNLTADINTVVSRNETKIINVSLGECETYTQQDGSAAAQDQSFAQAVAQGQTFSISTGDSGADECGTGGTTPSWPAASQYVAAIAGTRLDASTTTWNSETVWSDSGGSQSTFEPKPSWQTLWSGSRRGVADVAFAGDPSSGAKIVYNGSYSQVGGTSLSAPIFAGMWARVIAVKGSNVGFAMPLVYQLPASDFHDITSGNNGGSTAGSGYDLASGRGSMILNSAINHIGGGGGGNNPPTANFTFTTSGLTANFTDTSSDSDGSISSRSWNFGDGSTSTATNPSHTYSANGTYSVVLTVTDNGGATDTHTASVTVSGGGGGGGNVLQNGVPATGLSATTGNSVTYTMSVPSGATNLVFQISGGTGDADLYVRYGSAPGTSSGTYDCRPYLNGNSESCSFASPTAGTWYVTVRAYASFSGVSLVGSYTAGGGGGGNVLQNGVPVSGLSASRHNSVMYTMTVPAGATNLVFHTSGGSGDGDLYVKFGSAPTTSSYTCRSWAYGNTETCTISAPSAGTYYVMVYAYSAFSGLTLTGSYNP